MCLLDIELEHLRLSAPSLSEGCLVTFCMMAFVREGGGKALGLRVSVLLLKAFCSTVTFWVAFHRTFWLAFENFLQAFLVSFLKLSAGLSG